MSILCRVAVTVLLLMGSVLAGRAQEMGRILEYRSEITVNPDATLDVRDTIAWQCPPNVQASGLYRFFRTEYDLGYGFRRLARYDFREVYCDGSASTYRVHTKPEGQLLEIGLAGMRLGAGTHTYTVGYHTEKQWDLFPDRDELYWHVTGGGWEMPIDKASAIVTLPAGAQPLSVTAYIGRSAQASEEVVETTNPDGTRTLTFTARRPLKPHEGLTILVTLPPATVAHPTAATERADLMADNVGAVIAFGAFGGVLLYYLLFWILVGRDPQPGRIQPQIAPPANVSPAVARFLRETRYDPCALAAALLSLATKGLIHISELNDRYIVKLARDGALKDILRVTQSERENALSLEEETVARILFGQGPEFRFEGEQADRIRYLVRTLSHTLKLRCQEAFLRNNAAYPIIGMGLGTLALATAAVLEIPAGFGVERTTAAAGMVILGAGLPFLPDLIRYRWRDIFSHKVGRIGNGLIIFGYIVGIIAYLVIGAALVWDTSTPLLVILVLMSGLHVAFAHLLKAPTVRGRKLLDQLEGFRQYLSGEHPYIVKQLNPPPLTPELFQQYLPYALALGVEIQWAAQFAPVFRHGQRQEGPVWLPWYDGEAWQGLDPVKLATSLGEEFAVSMTPITVPTESSVD